MTQSIRLWASSWAPTTTSPSPLKPQNCWPASRSCCAAFPSIPATAPSISAPFASTCARPKSPAKANPSISPHANFSFFAISSSAPAKPFPAMNCCAPSGDTTATPSPGLSIPTSPACGKNSRRTPNSRNSSSPSPESATSSSARTVNSRTSPSGTTIPKLGAPHLDLEMWERSRSHQPARFISPGPQQPWGDNQFRLFVPGSVPPVGDETCCLLAFEDQPSDRLFLNGPLGMISAMPHPSASFLPPPEKAAAPAQYADRYPVVPGCPRARYT